MKQIYVLRSEDEKCTKIGISWNVGWRVDTICTAERKRYYLVFNSQPFEDKYALEVERKVKEHFKEDRIRGQEWLSAHPLDVIKFIVDIIGTPPKIKDISFDDFNCKYDVWLATNSDYKNISYVQYNKVKVNKNYIAYVRFLYNAQFITLGFSNIGDANKFAQKYRHNIHVTPVITKLLFGKTYNEWYYDTIADYPNCKWLFI